MNQLIDINNLNNNDSDRIAPKGGYEFDAKSQYRSEVWGSFSSVKNPKNAKVLLMPSREGIEIQVALDHGFQEKNITCVDRSKRIMSTSEWVKNYPEVTRLTAEIKDVGNMIKSNTIDIANLDMCGNLGNPTTKAVKSFVNSGCLKKTAYIAITMVKGRESEIITDMLAVVKGDRIALVSNIVSKCFQVACDVITQAEYKSGSNMVWGIMKVSKRLAKSITSPSDGVQETPVVLVKQVTPKATPVVIKVEPVVEPVKEAAPLNGSYFVMESGGQVFVSNSPMIGGNTSGGSVAISTNNDTVSMIGKNVIENCIDNHLYRVNLSVSCLGSNPADLFALNLPEVVLNAPAKQTVKQPVKNNASRVKKKATNNSKSSISVQVGYTGAEITTLLDLREKGYSAEQIGIELNRTTCSVRSKLGYMSSKGEVAVNITKKFTKEDSDAIISMIGDGITVNEISKKTDRTIGSIYSKIARLKSKGLV